MTREHVRLLLEPRVVVTKVAHDGWMIAAQGLGTGDGLVSQILPAFHCVSERDAEGMRVLLLDWLVTLFMTMPASGPTREDASVRPLPDFTTEIDRRLKVDRDGEMHLETDRGCGHFLCLWSPRWNCTQGANEYMRVLHVKHLTEFVEDLLKGAGR